MQNEEECREINLTRCDNKGTKCVNLHANDCAAVFKHRGFFFRWSNLASEFCAKRKC